ncbi:MAG TPA: pyruvate kinase [Acidimicrobiales bacterium]|nr:pyruvate kinase [Acidimicrobiales bacterium]
MRRTKIIATMGPASESEAVLKDMVEAGADVIRINLSHGSLDEAIERYRRLRRIEESIGRPLGILVDLPGPKVRAGSFPEGGALLRDGEDLRLVPGEESSTAALVHVDHEGLLRDIHAGDRLTFGDGGVVIEVTDAEGDALRARVLHGGLLQGRPGVHIPSERLRMATPTDHDLHLLDAFVTEGADMVAVSFVRSAHDIRRVGTEPHPAGPMVIAKIETRAAVENLDGIIEAAGAVMVARGDLGAEMPLEELPHLQKRILHRCIALGRPAITATQMLESMVSAPSPTRAETSDIANAVFDGSSAVMLSGETAIGHDPALAVATMARIARRADEEFDYDGWAAKVNRLNRDLSGSVDDVVTNSMTNAAWRAASESEATSIICITRTGFTVRSIARYRPRMPILGFSTDPRTLRQLTLSWGATPIEQPGPYDPARQVGTAIEMAKGRGLLRTGDLVAVLSGSPDYKGVATDSLRLVHI